MSWPQIIALVYVISWCIIALYVGIQGIDVIVLQLIFYFVLAPISAFSMSCEVILNLVDGRVQEFLEYRIIKGRNGP